MGFFKRTALRIVGLTVIAAAVIGILSAGGYIQFGTADAVTKATGEIISRDEVDGSFVVFINKDLHTDADVLTEWEKFFRGESYGFIFEDITCYVASSDAPGMEMAEGLRSRLPENQMKIKTVSSAMIVEKAKRGVFDVIVMSDLAVEQLGAQSLKDMPAIDVLMI